MENSKSGILACLNVISSLTNSEIQTGDDVVSDKVPILRQTKSTDDVKISEGLKLSQRNQIQR